MAPAAPADLRFADVQALLVVERLSSITAAARHLGVTPSQVSKAVARIESHLGATLLRRSAQGVSLTESGRRLVPRLHEIMSQLHEVSRVEEDAGTLLTVAAPSYMNLAMLPVIARALPEMRIRGLELPPSLVRTFAAANLFDATLLMGAPRLPGSWVVTRVATCRKSVFASPRLSEQLGRTPVPVERLRAFPFVSPIYNVGGQFVPVDDDCPIPSRQRKQGHEAQTIGIALEIAAQTDQLVYGPAFAAYHHLARGAVVEVAVEGWDAKEDVHLGCNEERTLARVQSVLVAALADAFARLEQGTRQLRVACT